jgi:hypothetical protein
MRSRTDKTRRGTSWASVCRMALQLPGVTQGTSYGTPALHVKKRFLARLKEDGETMAIRMEFADRDVLMELDPDVFYLTDHYRPYQAVLVRLEKAPPALVRQVLEKAWRFQAPRSMVARERPRQADSPAERTQRKAGRRSANRRGRTRKA